MPHFFHKVWEKLFSKEAPHPSQPFVSGPLQRKESEKKRYFHWVQEPSSRIFCQLFYHNYLRKLQGEDVEWNLQSLQTPYASGFALVHGPEISADDFCLFFDWLKDRVLLQPYRLVNAEHHMYDRAEAVEEVEKYYLKPHIKPSSFEEPLDQFYGNILIEMRKIDGQPAYLKLVATVYSDRQYKNALPFAQLMEAVFS